MWRTVITNWWFKYCNLTAQSLDPSRSQEINMTVSVAVTSLTLRKINCLTWETDTKTLSKSHHFPSGRNLQLSNCYGSNVFCVSSQITHPATAATYSVKLVPLWLDFLLSPTHSCLKPYAVYVVINMVLHGPGATLGALARAVAKLQRMSLSSCHHAVQS